MTEAPNTPAAKPAGPMTALNTYVSAPNVQDLFRKALGDQAGIFLSSLVEIAGADNQLIKCNPKELLDAALKAATLKLPLSKSLGHAWLVPRKTNDVIHPTFQIGWKGLVQLALRTRSYLHLNADEVFVGEYLGSNRLTGEPDLSGTRTGDAVTGYFAHMETLGGFKKTIYWSHEKVVAHAKKYAPGAMEKSGSAWKTSFPGMAKKTVLTELLSKYGIVSIEMAEGFASDDTAGADNLPAGAAASDIIDVDPIVNGAAQLGQEEKKTTATGKQPITPGF